MAFRTHLQQTLTSTLLATLILFSAAIAPAPSYAADDIPLPAPLLAQDQAPTHWWFVFKFNAGSFPACGENPAPNTCPFGGTLQQYPAYSQQYIYASDANPNLQQGTNCVGTTATDPIGATFGQIYAGNYYYVVWNDQFYGDPLPNRSDSWGHSKGILAWNNDGNGVIIQVSTPSWPASGNTSQPRQTLGDTLGCISSNNNILVSQHFFALSLNHDDVRAILRALQNSSVVTTPKNPQIVNNGGPQDLQDIVLTLGIKSRSTTVIYETLSSGVQIISKPSALHVPPWQMVSAELAGTPLRTATWWMKPAIPTTTKNTPIACWDKKLPAPSAVEIATSGQWSGITLGLTGGPGRNNNHAKLGVSTEPSTPYVIFGDLNQQGALAGNCASSQNQRGGLFFIINNQQLFTNVTSLLAGKTSPPRNR